MVMIKKCDKEISDTFESGYKVAKLALKKRWELVFVCAKFSVLNPGLKQTKVFERSGICMKFGNSQKDLRTIALLVTKELFEEIIKLSIFKSFCNSINTLTCVLSEKNMNSIKMIVRHSTHQGEAVIIFIKVADKIYFSNQIKLKTLKSYFKNNKLFFKLFKKKLKEISTAFKSLIYFSNKNN